MLTYFLHTFTHVPVNEGALGIHEVEFVVEATPRGSNSRGTGELLIRTATPVFWIKLLTWRAYKGSGMPLRGHLLELVREVHYRYQV